MRYAARWLGLLMGLALVVPSFAADEQKDADTKVAAKDKADAKDKKDTKSEKDKLVPAGEVSGKLVKLDTAQKLVTIEVTVIVGKNKQNQRVEYAMADDVQVLLANPPVEFDDKGKPKKLNPTELAKLNKTMVKGPLGRKWYPGDLDSLHTDQGVLAVLKKKKPMKTGAKAEENKPIVTTICITYNPVK